MTNIEHYFAPTSLADALAAMAAEETTLLAGGTDLMPQSQAGRLRFKPLLMNIRRIPELAGIALAGDELRIGALTTMTQLAADPLVRSHTPVLVEAVDHFASDQIRNAGTLGGNVCNASPAGDMLVPLLVLDARVELASRFNGALATRMLPLKDFFAGPGRTTREPRELLVALRVPLPPAGFVARFFKFGTRPALDISAISIGLGGVLRDGAFHGVRVAFGAVAPTPVRAPATEAALEGRTLDAAVIAAAAAAARDEVRPISDLRASAWYRQELIHNMTRRMLEDVARS